MSVAVKTVASLAWLSRVGSLMWAAALLFGAAQALARLPEACSDFDNYVNGRWQATAELPAHRARIGSFDTLRTGNSSLLQSALAELAADSSQHRSPGLQLLATYYRAGNNVAAIERQGLAPVAPLLAAISSMTRESLPALLADLARHQIPTPLTLSVGTDAKDSSRHALRASQSGLGLPDREDYLRSDSPGNARRLQAAYREHAGNLLRAASAPADEATLDALMAFETELAKAMVSRVVQRDPNASYNPFTVASLQELAPGFDWQAWLAAYTGVAEAPAVIVGQPTFAQAVALLAQKAPLETWKTYLRVRLLDATAEHLPSTLAASHFAYRGAVIRGLKQPPPRSEQLILAIGGPYGAAPLAETLGELYASKAFSPEAQARARQMLADIKLAMHNRIGGLPWMSEPTKLLARAKLESMEAKIGVPERWKTYEGLQLDPADHAGNLRDWWQPADAAAYKERADRIAALYSGFEPAPGLRINGQLTLGENISDIGGVQIAYEGLQIALARQRAAGQEPPLIDGMSPEQRFFMANATIWRSKMRPEALADQLRTDSHSPGRFRVLAPLANMPAFAQAFGCQPGDAMVAAEPIAIW